MSPLSEFRQWHTVRKPPKEANLNATAYDMSDMLADIDAELLCGEDPGQDRHWLIIRSRANGEILFGVQNIIPMRGDNGFSNVCGMAWCWLMGHSAGYLAKS